MIKENTVLELVEKVNELNDKNKEIIKDTIEVYEALLEVVGPIHRKMEDIYYLIESKRAELIKMKGRE